MPNRAPSVCAHCGKAHTGTCRQRDAFTRERKARFDRTRPTASARGYDATWRRESKAFLAEPANRYCACGCGRVADVVDHKVPHRGNQQLFWDRRNWQPMNHHCHNSAKQRHERRLEGDFTNV
jgi:5-methylcytosine-specific restriction endonuclease McrA